MFGGHVVGLFVKFVRFAVGPRLPGVAAPQRPRDAAGAGVTILAGAEALGLFVDFVAGKVGLHPTHGVGRKILAILNVARSGHSDFRAASVKLLAPLKAALGLGGHRFGRLKINGHRETAPRK